jgi:hypothetical protein
LKTGDDGRVRVVAHRNIPIPFVQAERLGIIPQEGASAEQLSEIEPSAHARRPVRSVVVVENVAPADAANAASGQANGQHAPNTAQGDPSAQAASSAAAAATSGPKAKATRSRRKKVGEQQAAQDAQQ